MKRSTERILTSHCGSLPRPPALLAALYAKDAGDAYDAAALARGVRSSVKSVVRKQVDTGIDVLNDGEHSKSSFAHYARTRLGGIERRDEPPRYLVTPTRDALAFPSVYDEMRVMYAARADKLGRPRGMRAMVCSGPLRYIGHEDLKTDLENLKEATAGLDMADAFITAISPTSLEMYMPNEFYRSQEEYLTAAADAIAEEYRAIVDAGFILQIDDPRLITYYNRSPGLSAEENRKFIAVRVEVLNYALRGIAEERVRFHTCYSVNVAPRVHDLELKHYIDLLLRIKAQTYSFEAANPRHEHEWKVWQEVGVPEGKVLMPGVVSHCVYQVEHPELVAQRIERFAQVAGRENVIAANDCGFATASAGDEVHPDVAWAKLAALVEGAEMATRRLWS
ncbi:MAG: cobalamin-independent methionine synthase II family protein [Xanthobacteraceae bacterium]